MTAGSTQQKGFFASLFDFGFTSFVTLKFLRVVYIVALAVIGLTGFGLFLTYLSQGGVYVLIAIVGTPILMLVYLLLVRVGLETIALLYRIEENTSIMAAAGGAHGAVPGPPSPYTMPAPAYGVRTAPVPEAAPAGPQPPPFAPPVPPAPSAAEASPPVAHTPPVAQTPSVAQTPPDVPPRPEDLPDAGPPRV